ncbi:MAG: hypothetical protein M5U01_33110 [Ardenticatenaceae bacterium]|nr:hypothetical protein [Ardenticatenaceae bacterium]
MADLYRIGEVLNYGGFFAGDTVTLLATPLAGGEEHDFTIDENAFTNVIDRHKIIAGMILALEIQDDKVATASLVGAASREALRAAIDTTREPPPPAESAVRVFAYRCPDCHAWIRGEPQTAGGGDYRCLVCGTPLG